MPTPRRSTAFRILGGLLIFILVIAAGRLLPISEWLQRFQEQLQNLGPSAPLIFVIVYAICCIVFIPASALSVAAGAIFGLPVGIVVVLSGAIIGALGSFLLGRTLLRRRAAAMIEGNRSFEAIDRAIGREGGRIVFLVRLSPIFPFTWVNYVFGLTAVRIGTYTLATFLGIVPGTIAFVYLGAAAATVASGEAGPLRTALQVTGAVATLAVSIVIARIARRAIAEAGIEADPLSDGTPAAALPEAPRRRR